jgi:hypothetical protein
MRLQNCSDNKHHSTHPNCPEHQTWLSSEFVDADKQEDASGHDFDRAVDTCGEECGIGLADPYGLEYLRSIIPDRIRAAHLLPKHDKESEEESLPVARQQRLPPGDTLCSVEFFFDGCPNGRHLLQDGWRSLGFAPGVRERCKSLFMATLFHQPTRAFLQKKQPEKH